MAVAAKLTCAGPGCRNLFVPARSTAKFCSPSCSQRARRGTKKPAAKPVAKKVEPKAAAKKPETKKVPSAADSHELVVALRKELEDAGALDNFEGQLAIELAKRLVQADSAASSLAGQVRTARAAALELAGGKPTPTPSAQPVEEEDEVTRARKQREESRQAAGLT